MYFRRYTEHGVDVVEWSRALDVRLSEWCWCGFKSPRGKNTNLTALKSNSNTVWLNFQIYIYIYAGFQAKEIFYGASGPIPN